MTHGPFALDTSVVIRLLVQEPEGQFQLAQRFLRGALESGAVVSVPELVLAEAYFALQSFYLLPKADALQALLLFVQHSGVTVSPSAQQVLSLPNLATLKPGFVDRLIHGTSLAAGQTLVTFEKAAKKLSSALVLGG